MPRRACLALLLALLATGPLVAQERPNVVIFLADDLGYGDLGCYGHPVVKTPNLDRFATQGVRFTQCYSASAVCSPSRSAILTGRTPYRNGVYTWIPAGSDIHLRTSEVTLATLLRRAGYATCHIGKWHLNGLFNSKTQPQPGDHGFDWWMSTQNNAAPSHKDPNNFARNGQDVGPMEGYSAPLVVDEAVRWLTKERDKAKPFFLCVWTHEPHLPIEAAPELRNLYPDLVKSDPDKAQHHADVTQMDHAFGKLMKALDDLKLSGNTLVIFTSDNGPEGNGVKGRTRGSTGGLRGRKRSLYAGGIQVPGMIRWPGKAPASTTSDVPIIGSDLFPTVLAAAGAPVPKDRVLDGANILAALDGKPVERKVPMYWRYHGAPEPMKVALRDGDWKIMADQGLTKFELYDLKADPRETTDLAAKEPERLQALQKTLRRLHDEIEREGPQWWRQEVEAEPKPNKKKAAELPTPRSVGREEQSGRNVEVPSPGRAEAPLAGYHGVSFTRPAAFRSAVAWIARRSTSSARISRTVCNQPPE